MPCIWYSIGVIMKESLKNVLKTVLYVIMFNIPYIAGWLSYPLDNAKSRHGGNLIFLGGFIMFSIVYYFYKNLED